MLLGDLLSEFLLVVGLTEGVRLLWLLVAEIVELAGKILFGLDQLLSLVLHVAQLLLEFLRRLTLEFFPQVVEFALGTRSLGSCLGYHLLLDRFAGPLDVLASLLQLLPLLGHAFLVLRLFHSLLQFFGIAQNLFLLLPQSFELLLGFCLFFCSFGGFQCGLQLLDSLVEVFLPLGQLTKAIQNLPILAGLLLLLGLGLLLLGVAVFVFVQLKLLQLLLRAAVLGLLRLALLLLLRLTRTNDFMLASTQAKQPLVSGLFRLKCSG